MARFPLQVTPKRKGALVGRAAESFWRSDDTFRGSFAAGRAIEEGEMAIVVPNVATAEECLELADAA